jgi:SNF2 family DNA or RNA helicase
LPDDAMQSYEAQLPSVETEDVSLDELGRIEVSTFPLDVPALDAPEPGYEILKTRRVQGRAIKREFPSLDGAGALPRAYLETDPSGLSVTERWIEEIVPVLSPPVISEESEIAGTPYSIRPYQHDGMQALMAEEGILLADDLGTGKSVIAILSMAKLFQEAHIKRALVVAPVGWIRHWANHLQNWAPSLSLTVVQGDPRERQLDWQNAAHVYVASYTDFAADIEAGMLPMDRRTFDLVVLDGVGSISRYSMPMWENLSLLSSDRRWVLASGLPTEQEDWLSYFRFLNPNLTRGLGSMSSEELHRHFASHVYGVPNRSLLGQFRVMLDKRSGWRWTTHNSRNTMRSWRKSGIA